MEVGNPAGDQVFLVRGETLVARSYQKRALTRRVLLEISPPFPSFRILSSRDFAVEPKASVVHYPDNQETKMDDKTSLPTKAEVIDLLETWVDTKSLNELENKGILKRKSKTPWYHILKSTELPPQVSRCATGSQYITKNGETILLLKFPSTDSKRVQSLLTKIK